MRVKTIFCAAVCWLACALPGASGSPPRGEMRRAAEGISSFPFQAVGVYWRDGSAGHVRVRAGRDSGEWSDWMEASGEALGDGRMTSGLLFFGENYQRVEVQGVPDPEVIFIDPGQPSAVKSAPRAEGGGESGAPPLITREQWGCTPQSCPAKDAPLYTTVTHLIVHHTDGVNTASDWNAVVRSIWVLHVQGNGWNDIGYNYLVDPAGRLYEGRAGGDGVLGAHFSSVNSGTMGVALLGTYVDATPPPAMLETLQAMLSWQARKWSIDPSAQALHAASGLVLNTIGGHRDANASPRASGGTECPGNTAYTFLPAVRREVSRRAATCVLAAGERNRCAGAEGGAISLGLTWDAERCGAAPAIATDAEWLSAVAAGFGVSGFTVNAAVNTGSRRSAVVKAGGPESPVVFTITQAASGEGALPCIATRGVVNAADFDERPVGARGQTAIFGEHFGGAAASVAIDGKPAAVEFGSETQINLNLPAGLSIGTHRLTVTANGVPGPGTSFSVTEAMPAIFSDSTGRALMQADGRTVSVFVTGAGTYPWSATIGGAAVEGLTLQAAPMLPGVFQVTLRVPDGLPAGEYPVAITVQGVRSQPAMISLP